MLKSDPLYEELTCVVSEAWMDEAERRLAEARAEAVRLRAENEFLCQELGDIAEGWHGPGLAAGVARDALVELQAMRGASALGVTEGDAG